MYCTNTSYNFCQQFSIFDFNVERDREKDRKTERQKDRKTERQKDRKTERQKDRKTEKSRERERGRTIACVWVCVCERTCLSVIKVTLHNSCCITGEYFLEHLDYRSICEKKKKNRKGKIVLWRSKYWSVLPLLERGSERRMTTSKTAKKSVCQNYSKINRNLWIKNS